ncbi:hypothetical protein ACFQO7_18820 [Catellatospora aurea]|uniref:Uncharacterized protein n=1 Tax=Catellatospora aurea TaxID=1337874 RepID=A0ABW2GX90_9ACTN
MRRYFKILFLSFAFLATRPTRLLLFVATISTLALIDQLPRYGLPGWLAEALKIIVFVIMSCRCTPDSTRTFVAIKLMRAGRVIETTFRAYAMVLTAAPVMPIGGMKTRDRPDLASSPRQWT